MISPLLKTPPEAPILVFDWGDTLMKTFPEYSGPMATWPQLAAVDGIVSALEALKNHFHMIVATGAVDSDSPLVWKAFERVGLDQYFIAVFTSRELGARKGSLGFYSQIEKIMGRPSHEMIMIGDSFLADVLGPKQAGWRALWFNPSHLPATGLFPVQDDEFYDLSLLPSVIARPALPDLFTALTWLLERGTPSNILAHIQLVAAASYQLAVWLGAKGVDLNPVLTQRGALLHDLCKMDSIRLMKERGDHGDHARMARDLLIERGQPEIAEIADRHMPVSSPSSSRNPLTWEQKIVHYADKLAEGAILVTPEERFQALRARYPDFNAELTTSQPFLYALQAEISAALALTPEELFTRVKKSVSDF